MIDVPQSMDPKHATKYVTRTLMSFHMQQKISHLQRNQIERRSVTSRYHGSTITGRQKTQRRRRRQGEQQKIICSH